MHSLKQTVIAVILLGVSFGLYQVSLTPSSVEPAGQGQPKSGAEKSDQGSGANLFQPSQLSPNSDPAFQSEAATPQAGATDSKPISISSPPALGAAPPKGSNLAIPELPKLPGNEPNKPELSAGDRVPLNASNANGVQSIHYPDLAKPNATSDSQIVQREPLKKPGDQGLLDVLKSQDLSPPTSANPASPNRDFVATVPRPEAFPTKTDFSAVPPTSSSSSSPTSSSTLTLPMNPPANELPKEPVSQPKDATTSNSGFKSPSEFTPSGQPAGAVSFANTTKASVNESVQYTYKTVWPKVDELVAAEDYHSALKLLSRFYRDENLNGPQRQRLLGWLDALAGKVIFSAEDHLTGKPYASPSQEKLVDIAKRWQVPVQLISNVHGPTLANREVVPAGTKLKEIPGPFHAELKLKARVITLYLGDMYAGRFPVVIGTSGEPRPGIFDIVLKSEGGYAWFDEQGREFAPDAVENGYGPHWIGLSGSICIHAVADNAVEGHRGCIGLSRQDAADLFSILSETSKLTIIP